MKIVNKCTIQELPIGQILCGDCLDVLRTLPDGCIDAVITDPPYGIGMAGNPVRQKHERKGWDETIPGAEYFAEIRRVSKAQIIWGGNYFTDHLPASKCWLVWNKVQPENFTLAMCEMAWTSFDSPAKLFTHSVHCEGNHYHPTQKPQALMRWQIALYTDPNALILDPFCGSGSTLTAAERLGRRWIGVDISPEYCAIARKRTAQKGLDLQ